MESSFSDYGTNFRALIDHCEQNELKFRADPESKSVHCSICWETAVYGCTMRITHDEEVFQIFLHFPVMAKAPSMRAAVAELVARANHGLTIGHLDIDMDDGEIHYHVGHVIAGHGLEDSVIGNLLLTSLVTSERYFVALMRLMFGGHTPGDAVYLAELDAHTARVEDALPSPSAKSPAGSHPAPRSAKPRRSPRKDKRQKATEELPGLFQPKPQPPAPADGESSRPCKNDDPPANAP
ncbi:MAG: YbjN domain-containing protein [Chthoniobacterales bacterium]|jgi:hypothetical protein